MAPRGRAAAGGVAYFAIVFSCAFALGTVRVLLVTPRLGPLIAVLVEAPLVLAISWLACGWCVRRLGIGRVALERLAMGLVAFVVLMTAELGLAVTLFGQTAGAWAHAFQTAPGVIGLLAQMAFALVPLAQRIRPAE